METGIAPDEEILTLYKDFKINRAYKCIILALNKAIDGLEVVFKGDKDFQYKDLADQLPKDDSRFVLVYFEYETDEKPPRKTDKIILIYWCPSSTNVRRRFSSAGSKKAIQTACSGIQKDIMASDYSDIDYDEVRKECLKP
jgi:cofilin